MYGQVSLSSSQVASVSAIEADFRSIDSARSISALVTRRQAESSRVELCRVTVDKKEEEVDCSFGLKGECLSRQKHLQVGSLQLECSTV